MNQITNRIGIEKSMLETTTDKVTRMTKQFKSAVTPNSITFYFKNDCMKPNPMHLERRLPSIKFNRENSECMEYIGRYEFWNSESRLKDMLADIHYLRRYCKQRTLFLKEVIINTPLNAYLDVLTKFAKTNNGFLTQTWKHIAPQKSRIIGYNLEFKGDEDITGSD